ncbi:MAG: hypothetical protein ACF8Q5_00005, partial [Phycisphaerales bacterium JB040]
TDDGTEVDLGSDPNDPSDGGEAPPPDELTSLAITVGDPSGSHSEHWSLEIENVIEVWAPAHGQVTEPPKDVTLRRGEVYTITVHHRGSLYSEPDYDYIAVITPEDESIIIIDDPDGLLGSHGTNGETSINHAEGLSATLYMPLVDLDIDSDNDNSFDPPSRTRDENDAEDVPGTNGKLLFVNDDDVDEDGVPDYADGFDLRSEDPDDNESLSDDFAPLVLELHALPEAHNTKIIFEYEASDPLASEVVHIPHATYVALPEEGALRIWTKPPNEPRFGSGLSAGGDYIEPGEEYTLTQLGYTDSEPLTLWVEAVQPSYEIGDLWINASIKGMDGDTVRLTACKPEFVTWDEETGEEVPLHPTTIESQPQPVVQISLTSMNVDTNNNLVVDIAWSVKDSLSDLINSNDHRVNFIYFKVNGRLAHEIALSDRNDLSGTLPWQPYHCNATGSTELSIPPLFADPSDPDSPAHWDSGSIVIYAETSPNAAGRVGTDDLSIVLKWSEGIFAEAIEVIRVGERIAPDGIAGTPYSLVYHSYVETNTPNRTSSRTVAYRLPVLTDATADRLALLYNDELREMRPFTYSPEKWYVVAQDDFGHPHIMVLTGDSLPEGIVSLKPSNFYPVYGSSEWRVRDDNNRTISTAEYEVLPSGFDFFLSNHYDPDKKTTLPELYAAYLMLYGDAGADLLHYYLEGGNTIELGNVYGNLDVIYRPLFDTHVKIRIEKDINPLRAAEKLALGLREARTEPPVVNAIPASDIDAVIDAYLAAWDASIDAAVASAKMYFYAVTAFTDTAGDIVFVISDLADGNWKSAGVNAAFAMIPFVPANINKATQVGRKIRIKAPGSNGFLLELTHEQHAAIVRAVNPDLGIADKYTELSPLFSVKDRERLIDAGVIWYPTGQSSYRIARQNKIDQTTPNYAAKPEGDFHLHHDFPVAYEKWFLAHGIDINHPAFTRWIHRSTHNKVLHTKIGEWHHSVSGTGGGRWNVEWKQFIDDEVLVAGEFGYTREQVIQKMEQLRADIPID